MATKRRKAKNPHAVALGRKGGKASSPAKTAANRANVRKRWALYAAKVGKAT
jgi:hypothetical protein